MPQSGQYIVTVINLMIKFKVNDSKVMSKYVHATACVKNVINVSVAGVLQ